MTSKRQRKPEPFHQSDQTVATILIRAQNLFRGEGASAGKCPPFQKHAQAKPHGDARRWFRSHPALSHKLPIVYSILCWLCSRVRKKVLTVLSRSAPPASPQLL